MRLFKIILLCLVFSSILFAQVSDKNFQFKGKFDFENPNEEILVYKFLNGTRLQLIGPNTFQIWDVAEAFG